MLKEHKVCQEPTAVQTMERLQKIMEYEMYHYGKPYNAKEKLIKAINDWIYYNMYERNQKRFGVKTPYEANPYLYKYQINIQYLKTKE